MALDIGKIRNVAFVGHGGVGKTSLVEALLHACGATTRLGKVDDGTTHHRLRPRRDQAQDLAQHRGGLLRPQGPSPQPDRHPRVRRLRGRRPRGVAGGRRGDRGGGRGGGRAGADREGLEVRQRVQPAARDRDQPTRPRARRLPPHARGAAEAAEGSAGAAAAADRQRGRLPRGDGPDHDARPRPTPTAGRRTPRSRPTWRRAPGPYREKLTEAAAETDDDLLAKYLEEGAIGEEEMLSALRRAIMSGGGGAGALCRRHARHRHRVAARPHREGVPVARGPG